MDPISPFKSGTNTFVSPSPGGLGTDLGNTAASIYNAIFPYLTGFVGAIVLFYIIWGGIKYMQAGADTKKAEAAKNMIIAAVIGAAIVIGTFTIINFSTAIGTALNGIPDAAISLQPSTGP